MQDHVFPVVSADGTAVDLRVTASIGVATLGGRADTAERLVRAADQALYGAKAGGRNRVVPYTAAPTASA